MRQTEERYSYRGYMVERWPSGTVSVTMSKMDTGTKRMTFERLLELGPADNSGETDRELLMIALAPYEHPVQRPADASGGQLELPLDPPKG